MQIGNDTINSLSGFNDLGSVVNFVSLYVFPAAGFLLLLFLASGGLDWMMAAGDPKKTEAAKEKITAAIIGFVIVFTGFWIYKIVLFLFGIT